MEKLSGCLRFTSFLAGDLTRVYFRCLADWRLGEACEFLAVRKHCVSLESQGKKYHWTRREYQRVATAEAIGFMELQVHPKLNGPCRGRSKGAKRSATAVPASVRLKLPKETEVLLSR